MPKVAQKKVHKPTIHWIQFERQVVVQGKASQNMNLRKRSNCYCWWPQVMLLSLSDYPSLSRAELYTTQAPVISPAKELKRFNALPTDAMSSRKRIASRFSFGKFGIPKTLQGEILELTTSCKSIIQVRPADLSNFTWKRADYNKLE